MANYSAPFPVRRTPLEEAANMIARDEDRDLDDEEL